MSSSDEIEKLLTMLDNSYVATNDRWIKMSEAYEGALYGVDFLAGAALNRTQANVAAFTHLIRSRNLLIAGALLRIQIDTALRFYASFLVEHPHDFALKVLAGDRIDLEKDQKGNRLTDKYLVDNLSKEFGWIKRVYSSTSGYIHLSGTHIHHTIENLQEDGKFQVKLSPKDKDLPDALYEEAILAFIEAIKVLLKHIDGWIYTKDNTEVIEKARNKQQNE